MNLEQAKVALEEEVAEEGEEVTENKAREEVEVEATLEKKVEAEVASSSLKTLEVLKKEALWQKGSNQPITQGRQLTNAFMKNQRQQTIPSQPKTVGAVIFDRCAKTLSLRTALIVARTS